MRQPFTNLSIDTIIFIQALNVLAKNLSAHGAEAVLEDPEDYYLFFDDGVVYDPANDDRVIYDVTDGTITYMDNMFVGFYFLYDKEENSVHVYQSDDKGNVLWAIDVQRGFWG